MQNARLQIPSWGLYWPPAAPSRLPEPVRPRPTMTDRPDAPRSRRDYRDMETINLIEAARGGDDRARDHISRRYLPRLEAWITGRLPSSAMGMLDTHDLVQEVLSRAFERLDRFEHRGDGAFLAYVRTAARNRLNDEYRRRSASKQELGESLVDAGPTPLDELIGADVQDRYERALEGLSPDYREAVIAYVEFGYGLDELVGILDKPSYDAARMTLRRALARLAEEMAE